MSVLEDFIAAIPALYALWKQLSAAGHEPMAEIARVTANLPGDLARVDAGDEARARAKFGDNG